MKLSDYEYYRTDLGVLYCGDCLEILPLLKCEECNGEGELNSPTIRQDCDVSTCNICKGTGKIQIDLCLTDPPYGINMDKGFSGSDGFGGKGKPIARREYKDKWDDKAPSKELFKIILKYKCLIFGGNFFSHILPQSSHWLVWDKKNTMPTFGDAELIYTNIDRKSVKIYEYEYNGLIGKEKFRDHPTQKPYKLILQLLKDYSKDTDIILDSFLGSGTTAVACEKLGRKWIGIEISEKYCEIAKKRIKAESDQLKMF